jgi:hypothetical protein
MSSTADPPRPKAPSPADPAGGPLEFELVPVRRRADGWTPERQRLYVAALARWGSGRMAAEHVGLTPQSAARLRRRPDAASFARACEAACGAGKIRRRQQSSGARTFPPQGAELSEKYEPSETRYEPSGPLTERAPASWAALRGRLMAGGSTSRTPFRFSSPRAPNFPKSMNLPAKPAPATARLSATPAPPITIRSGAQNARRGRKK